MLKDRTREGIMDRMCSGWGLNPMVNRLSTRYPTTFYHRTVNLQRGKAVVVGEGRAIDTLNSLISEHAFGEPNELIVVD
uniref:ATP-dependent DNA helicase n=1 Tax=Caenorhabditis tropicalis TaxID=1561998 RepID=A0A1I7UYV7_9PELO